MKANDVKISVVIPTCNERDELLQEALNCLRKQSLPPREVLIINNGEKTMNHDKSYGNAKIYNIDSRNGVAEARNYGVEKASGEYVAFLDDDDLWEHDYLRKVADVIERQSPDCIVTRLDRLVEGKICKEKNAEGFIQVNELLVQNPGVTGSSTVVKRETFLKRSGYDAELPPSEDKSLVLEMLLNDDKIVCAPHIQSIIRTYKGTRLSNADRMATGISRFLKKYRGLMNPWQKFWNLQKIYYYRYQARKRPFDLLRYYFFKSIRQPYRLLTRSNF